LQGRYRFGFTVDGSRKLCTRYIENGFTQPVRQQFRILNQEDGQIARTRRVSLGLLQSSRRSLAVMDPHRIGNRQIKAWVCRPAIGADLHPRRKCANHVAQFTTHLNHFHSTPRQLNSWCTQRVVRDAQRLRMCRDRTTRYRPCLRSARSAAVELGLPAAFRS
jgi:hypothetical protein